MEKHLKTQFSTNQFLKTIIKKGVSVMQNDPKQKKNSY
jgi:hypothetical protein